MCTSQVLGSAIHGAVSTMHPPPTPHWHLRTQSLLHTMSSDQPQGERDQMYVKRCMQAQVKHKSMLGVCLVNARSAFKPLHPQPQR